MKDKISGTLKFILISGWPVWIAIVGTLIMIFAGVNDCRGCSFFQNFAYMDWWGWIGLILVVTGLVYGFRRIIEGFLNIHK